MAASGGTRGPSRGSTWSAVRGVRSNVGGRERGERVSAVDGDAIDRSAARSEPREGLPIQQRWRGSAVARTSNLVSIAIRSGANRLPDPQTVARDELPRSIQRSPHGLGASLSERARATRRDKTSPPRASIDQDPRPATSPIGVASHQRVFSLQFCEHIVEITYVISVATLRAMPRTTNRHF